MARPATAAVRLLTGEREPVRLATTGNIDVDTGGLLTIDGVVTEVGDRVLVKDQTDGSENGIRTASEGQWYRAADARTARTMQKGTTVTVQEGVVNAGNVFRFNTLDPQIGDDPIEIVTSQPTADQIHGASSKPVPVDADEFGYADSEASFGLKKATWGNLKDAIQVTQPYTGAFARPAIAKLKNGPVCLEDFGFVSGNALAALNLALPSGAPIRLDGRTYDVAGLANVVTNTPVSIEGVPGLSALRFTTANAGLRINQADYNDPTMIRGVMLLTTQQEPGAALDVTYSKTDSITNRAVGRCILEDVWCRGEDINLAGWSQGIKITDVFAAEIIRPNVVGRKNNALSGVAVFKNMTAGIDIIGSDTPTLSAVPGNIILQSPYVSHSNYGVRSRGEVEGLICNSPVFVAADIGLSAVYTTTRVWTKVEGGHASIFTMGVELVNGPQSFVNKMCIYKSPITHTSTHAVRMTNCDAGSVTDIIAINQSQANDALVDGEFNGVIMENCNRGAISNINHERPSKTVVLMGTSSGCEVRNLRPNATYPNATVAVFEDTSSGGTWGANVYSAGNQPIAAVQNVGAVTVAGTLTTLASSPSRAAYKGERYLVQGMVMATKGATAGELVTQLTKSGTCTGVFGLLSRGAQAISANVAHSVSGIFTVTVSGTLAFSLSATSTGSDSNVVAGDGQLSVTLL
ncbi:hypothetical protein [Mesorhizobium amorphae]|uniref:hypothetical protein n=1 Tax=Mesorhizobium amorphae TaxID=71433 RepID=UPI00177DE4F9|nr:hypothetical protein [Mesorhizobium amorphae]